MNQDRVKRKLSAILSADVVGYSRLMGEDEVSTVRTLEAYRKVMSDLIEQFRGRVVDSPGDNLLAEFSSVVDAVQCAVEIHDVIRAKNEELPESRRMLFRIGVNLGDVIEEGDRIYGDGVNIAARLEGLAEAGGICISGTAHEHIKNKLALGYEYIGEHTVKNIAEPLKVYRVPMGPKTAISKEGREKGTSFKKWRWTALGAVGAIIVIIGALAIWDFYLRAPSIEPASIERMAYPLPDKPSIAVLPFRNMSGDPEQEYIGDGLSENIISALSVSSEIFVIASNSMFTYKGKPIKVQQVAEDLGVQYVLEGSIQKSGDRLRVTAQLIDALSGHHLWSDKYDREMKELFDLQDEITKEIVGYLHGELISVIGEEIRLSERSTENLEAWIHYIKGIELFNMFNADDNIKAREHFEAAVKIDPEFVAAWTKVGNTHFWDVRFGRSASPDISLKRASESVQKALELNKNDPLAHAFMGEVYVHQRQYEKAITMGKRAITLDPNFAFGHHLLGMTMLFSGRFDEAITLMERACRLDPNHHPVWLITQSATYIFLEHYEKALEVCNEMEEHVLNGRLGGMKYYPPLLSSWAYQELGREEEAHAYMAEALKRNPDLSLEGEITSKLYKNPAHRERMLDALRKAGMPEKPPGAVQEKPSIAVLPFDDLSPEKDQEYFVLGLSEEILNSLAQISDLTVIAKTSSFSFKGKDKTIQEIASVLDVDHILEGSVRKAGNALRITTQLVKAIDGSQLWSETYDRELRVKEIFAVQENIATSVYDELKVTLGIGKPLKQLGGTENLEAYELYLVASGQYNTLEVDLALESIDATLALDPEFAKAWALKAQIHIWLSILGPSNRADTELDAVLIAAQKAIELEPNLPEGYFVLGSYESARGNLIDAELNYRKALQLRPERISGIVDTYNMVGYFRRSREVYEKLRRNDPLNLDVRSSYVATLGLLRDTQGVENENDRCKALFGDGWKANSWGIAFHRLGTGDPVSRDEIEYSNPIFNAAKQYFDSPKEGLAKLHQLYSDENNLGEIDITNISILAAYFGDPEFAMDAIEKGNEINALGLFKIWYPVMKEVRQLPRFKEFIREIGLVDYWKEHGWPDNNLCRPVGDDDFVCD